MGGRRDRDWESWIAELLAGSSLREPPSHVLRRAAALGRGLRPARVPGLGWVVELLFDSTTQPLPVGVRGAAPAERRYLYGARLGDATCEIDLRLVRLSRGAIEVTGQILPAPGDGRVQATIGKTSRLCRVEPTGEFVLRRLPGHAPTLRLEIREGSSGPLVIEDVPLPEPTVGDA